MNLSTFGCYSMLAIVMRTLISQVALGQLSLAGVAGQVRSLVILLLWVISLVLALGNLIATSLLVHLVSRATVVLRLVLVCAAACRHLPTAAAIGLVRATSPRPL